MFEHKQARWSRRLSVVPRWVIVPTIQRQNVAEHSYHVAQTARWLMQFHASIQEERAWRELMIDVVLHALDHDMDEAATGDRPSTTKAGKVYHAGMPQYAIIVKVADILEALAFLHEERAMGNTRIGALFDERKQALREVWGFFKTSPVTTMGPSEILNLYIDVLNTSHPGME